MWQPRVVVFAAASFLTVGAAHAQTKDITGVWQLVSATNTAPSGKKSDLFGSNGKGAVVFERDRFVLCQANPDLPKVAANNRVKGTAEENQAIVSGTLCYFGTYTVSGETLTFKVEAGTYPNWNGTEQKRAITSLTTNKLVWTNPGASVGGTAEAAWERVKQSK